jgi:hypothetical protein
MFLSPFELVENDGRVVEVLTELDWVDEIASGFPFTAAMDWQTLRPLLFEPVRTSASGLCLDALLGLIEPDRDRKKEAGENVIEGMRGHAALRCAVRAALQRRQPSESSTVTPSLRVYARHRRLPSVIR